MMPDTPGAYLVQEDGETDWTPILVSRRSNGVLMANCPYCGTYELKDYHDNLINPVWRLASR